MDSRFKFLTFIQLLQIIIRTHYFLILSFFKTCASITRCMTTALCRFVVFLKALSIVIYGIYSCASSPKAVKINSKGVMWSRRFWRSSPFNLLCSEGVRPKVALAISAVKIA